MKAKNIALCLLTSLLCQASNFTVEKDISGTIGYMILANLVTLFQFTLWKPESVRSLKKGRKIAVMFVPFSLLIGSMFMTDVLITEKSVLVALGLHFICLRCIWALRYLGLLGTGLKLREDFKSEESKKVYAPVCADNSSEDSLLTAQKLKEEQLNENDGNQKDLEGWDWEVVEHTEIHQE